MPKPVLIGTTYYLRVRVPNDVVKIAKGTSIAVPVGDQIKYALIKDAVKVSLQTKDAAEAKRRFVTAHSAVETHWEMLRKGSQELTHKDALAIAGAIRQVWVDVMDDDPGSVEMWDGVLAANAKARVDAVSVVRVFGSRGCVI